MDGEDLSPLFDGDEPPERPYAYGGYFNHFYVRNGDWSYVADNRGDRAASSSTSLSTRQS